MELIVNENMSTSGQVKRLQNKGHKYLLMFWCLIIIFQLTLLQAIF